MLFIRGFFGAPSEMNYMRIKDADQELSQGGYEPLNSEKMYGFETFIKKCYWQLQKRSMARTALQFMCLSCFEIFMLP